MTKFDNNISFVKLTYLDIEQRILLKTQNKSENTKTIGKSYYLMLAIPTATAGSNNNITLSSGSSASEFPSEIYKQTEQKLETRLKRL